MSLYQQWVDLMDGQTQETFQDFWKKYSDTETRIYQHILAAEDGHLTGRVSDLITKFDAEPWRSSGISGWDQYQPEKQSRP